MGMAQKKAKPRSAEAVKLGETIRRRRLAINVSQDEFADMARMHRSYVGFVERGTQNVTLDTMMRISAALKVPLWTLFKEAGL